jgi:hypothetical protein
VVQASGGHDDERPVAQLMAERTEETPVEEVGRMIRRPDEDLSGRRGAPPLGQPGIAEAERVDLPRDRA